MPKRVQDGARFYVRLLVPEQNGAMLDFGGVGLPPTSYIVTR